MLGLWIGTLSLFGLFLLMVSGRRRHHHRWAHGGCGGRRAHGKGHHQHREDAYTGPDPLHVAFGPATAQHLGQKLGLADDQQDMVEAAMADTRRALDGLWKTVADSRGEIASALRGDSVDDARLAAVFEWHDEALAHARKELTTAWKAALLGLTPEQRARVADWVAGSSGRGWV
jgi:Spy/CpxP family protein refolding chaperone